MIGKREREAKEAKDGRERNDTNVNKWKIKNGKQMEDKKRGSGRDNRGKKT